MKKTMHFATVINAPREVVWNTMLGAETYRQWSTAFSAGSYYDGTWEEGSRIRFLAPDGSGMLSEVAENRPYERVSLRHIGAVTDGIEDTTSPSVREWAPSFETYTFREVDGATEVNVALDVMPDWEADMAAMWPKALDRLKALSESRPQR